MAGSPLAPVCRCTLPDGPGSLLWGMWLLSSCCHLLRLLLTVCFTGVGAAVTMTAATSLKLLNAPPASLPGYINLNKLRHQLLHYS